jgi:hypothetical protein
MEIEGTAIVAVCVHNGNEGGLLPDALHSLIAAPSTNIPS